MDEVAIKEVKQQPIAGILNEISAQHHFYFAYNNAIIHADSLISIANFNGTVFSFLEKILGSNYQFKEVPGYIILTYAPRKMAVIAEVSKEQGAQTIVKGYVNDVIGHVGINKASIYDADLLISTLTDDQGYFELKLKNYDGAIKLTASKENYRDTSLFILSEVKVKDNAVNGRFKYYPANNRIKKIEHSRFARFFIGSKQSVQELNIGDFFASGRYQFSFTPGLSTQGLYNSQVIEHISLNLLGGYTAGVNGIELALLFNINRRSMRYFQAAGIFNFVGDSTKGVQFAGVYNNVLNNAQGLQFGGLINQSHSFSNGVQLAGLANFDNTANGLKVAGITNIYRKDKGIAIGGVVNIAANSSSVQVAGLLNTGGRTTNVQLSSLMNVAGKVNCFQLGIINIADTSDYPIGIINIVKSGDKGFEMSTDANLYGHVDFISGGRVIYSLLGAGYGFRSHKAKYLLDAGLGIHLINKKMYCLIGEFVYSSALNPDLKKDIYHISSLKIAFDYKITSHFGLFAGPSTNLSYAVIGNADKINGWVIKSNTTNNHVNSVYLGITSGLHFIW